MTGPCNKIGAEISLKSKGLCNLTEVNGSDCEDMDELEKRVKAAAFIGTLQAGYTDFFYLRQEWKKVAEDEALLGVSITSVASLTWVTDSDLRRLAKVATDENKRVAKLIGINPAKRVTCIKPSGTTSLVLGTSSGIHAWYAKFYVRRIRLNKTEALYTYLKGIMPDAIEDDYLRPKNDAVLSIPMRAPVDSVLRSESALDTLDRVLRYSKNWIAGGHVEGLNQHNVSCTINVRDSEWEDLEGEMWRNRLDYTGISLLPHDNGTYQQPPFEEITEEQYHQMSRALPNIDLDKVVEETDNTDLSGELACGGMGCEVR